MSGVAPSPAELRPRWPPPGFLSSREEPSVPHCRWPFAGWTALLSVAWLSAVGGTMVAVNRYKLEPGAAAKAPATLPTGSAVSSEPGRATLIFFAHPLCPCTRASLSELAKLTTTHGAQLSTTVVFLRPTGSPESWEASALVKRARELAGVQVLFDVGGEETRRFGGLTSGQVLLYDAGGSLQFSGGITVARGHEGDSPGAERIRELLAGSTPASNEAPVFGCALAESSTRKVTP